MDFVGPQLRKDADRVLQLEADIKRRNEDLSNERITRANVEAALTTAERRLKESEHAALELQSTLDTVSRQASSSSSGRSKLEQDNAALQTRVRAMERELQNKSQAEKVALSRSHGPSGSRSRIQSPTDDSFRIPALEKEIAELRATSTQQASDLQHTTEQLTRARDQLVQVQNEKIAAERQLGRQLDAARAALEEREEDLQLLQNAHGGEDAAAREAGLLERLEMEEQRVAALEDQLARSAGSRKQDTAMLRDELDRTTQMLDDANDKLSTAESRLAQLTRDRESAYRDRDRLQRERDQLSENMREVEGRIRCVSEFVEQLHDTEFRFAAISSSNYLHLLKVQLQTNPLLRNTLQPSSASSTLSLGYAVNGMAFDETSSSSTWRTSSPCNH